MIAYSCLLVCALASAQPGDRLDWLLAPRLNQGQELVYRGAVSEIALGSSVEFSRSYRLEHRVFVLEKSSRGLEVAFFTALRLRLANKTDVAQEQDPSSVRLEIATVDARGKLMQPAGISFAVPLDGPTTVECGAFVEFPDERVRIGRSWEVIEDGRPIRIWKLTGLDTVNGSRCLALEGVQESEDWQRPRADHTAWRRQDKLWLLPDSGVPVKVERVLEKREPAHQRPTQRSCVQYELQDNMEYRNQLFEDRRHEILQAHKLDEALRPLTKNLSRAGIQPLDRIIARATFHLQSQPRTPYRDAILQVKRNAEAARRGEPPPTLRTEEPPTPVELQVGGRAPDFVATDVLTSEPARLRKWLGHTVVMVFYSPQSFSTDDVLHLGRSLQDTYHHRVNVLGFAVSDDYERIRRQFESLQLRFPVLSGKGLRQSYLVEATPKFVIIDAGGIVRGILEGWGPEIPEVVREELRKCVQADDNFTGGDRATKTGNAQVPMTNDQRMPKPE